MCAITTKIRIVLLVLTLACIAAPAAAEGRPSTAQTRTTEVTRARVGESEAAEERPPAGSPEFGLLIIIGVVGFVIFAAWLFSRVGDDNSPRTDRSII